tara:strand:+ start:47693 stop:48040 length:348 start_codon:yes stop_codon:yes gene_type:complete
MKLTGRRYLKMSILALVIIAILVSVFYFATTSYKDVELIAGATSGFVDTLRWFRWGIIILLTALWPQITAVIVAYKHLEPEQVQKLAALRWRVPVYLVIFELLVIESLPSKILGL